MVMKLLLVSLFVILCCSAYKVWRTPRMELLNFDVKRVLPLRGILALLIVAHHLSQHVSYLNLRFIRNFVLWGSIVVGVFFFITGYGLMVSYERKGTAYLKGFLSHRLCKLLPAFMLATFMWLLAMYVFKGISPFATIQEMVYGDTPLPNSWFVYTIVLFYLFFYLSARIVRNPVLMIVLLWCLSFGYVYVVQLVGWSIHWFISTYAISIGFTYAFCEKRVKMLLSKFPLVIVGLQAMVVGLLLVCVLYPDAKWLHWVNLACVIPIFVILSVYILGMRQNKVLCFFGKISYEIYLVQGCFMVAYDKLSYHWVIYFFLTYASSILAAFVLHKICGKSDKGSPLGANHVPGHLNL